MQPANHWLAEAWLTSVGADDPALFQRRISWDDLTPEKAASIFRSSGRSRDPGEFSKIQNWLRASSPIEDSKAEGSSSDIPFYELWDRVAIGAMCQLTSMVPRKVGRTCGLHKLQEEPRSGVPAKLHGYLVSRLAEAGQGVLWKEFISRRTPDQAVYAHLGDGTPGSRRIRRSIYCRLLEELRADELSALVATYPVLQVHLCTILEQWTR